MPDVSASADSPIRRRLRGEPVSREQAQAEYRRQREHWINTRADPERARVLAGLLWWPSEERVHRWRIELGCGHIAEIFRGEGADSTPADWRWDDDEPLHQMLPGEYSCKVKECRLVQGTPVRDIVSWDERLRTDSDPPEPEECPYKSMSAERWADLRHEFEQPFAVWRATLDCGHVAETRTPEDWDPSKPIARRPAKDNGQRERMAQMLRDARADGDEWSIRLLEREFPEPNDFHGCFTCMWARRIVAFEYVGLLSEPVKPTRAERRAKLSAQLGQAERRAERLRAQLSQLDEE